MVPPAFDYSVTPANIVQLQASRMLNFLQSAVETCNSLFVLRQGFLRSVRDEALVTPSALAPDNLNREIERLWRQALSRASLQTTAFVPGYSPNDRLAAFTDVENPLVELAAANAEFKTTPPSSIPVDTFPFSSRLPFVRADFIKGGLQYFYPLARIPGENGQVVPFLAGQARVSLATNSRHFPIFQVIGGGHATSGLISENSTFAPFETTSCHFLMLVQLMEIFF